jgi:HAD superfamily hydrolase (TIGR01549 family)
MDEKLRIIDLLSSKSVVFWDFDGVIKESIDIKTDAFVELFHEYGIEILRKIKEHHLSNGGMSRFEKIPIYLKWIGVEPTEQIIKDYCQKFNSTVVLNVINSKWVDGALDFIVSNKYNQLFYIVSATPDLEIKYIIEKLGIADSFVKIFGAPIKKTNAIFEIIKTVGKDKSEFIMIGDALSDFEAASNNDISFLFRKHDTNSFIFKNYIGPTISNFIGL